MTSKRKDSSLDLEEVMPYVLRDPRRRSAVHRMGDEPVHVGEPLLGLGGGGLHQLPQLPPPFLYDHDWPWIISRLWGRE